MDAGTDVIGDLLRGQYENPVVVIKHQKACGAATGEHAVELAYEGDPMNAFGGVWGFGRRFMREDAITLFDRPVAGGKRGWRRDVIFAPDFDGPAVDYVKEREGRRPHTRLVPIDGMDQCVPVAMVKIKGGALIGRPLADLYLSRDGSGEALFERSYAQPTGRMKADGTTPETRRVGVVSKRIPDSGLIRTTDFGVRMCRQQPSNATVLVRQYGTDGFQQVAYGIAEPGRSDTCLDVVRRSGKFFEREYKILAGTAEEHDAVILRNSAAAVRSAEFREMEASGVYERGVLDRRGAAVTDSFFPFRDGPDKLAETGVGLIVEPGGSVNDDEVIETLPEGIGFNKWGEMPKQFFSPATLMHCIKQYIN